MADTSCSDADHAIAGGKSGKDAQKELLMAGSIALQSDMPLIAVEHYKSALEKMNIKASQKIPMGLLVLRYALCIALIKCNGYKHIVEAVENLRELIDTGCASRLPALYLALAKAFYALNRYKRALDFIEKGLKAIQSNSKVKQHAWPGLQQTIEETGKDFLHKELLSLQKGCKNYSPPDAVCGYDKCEAISDHVSPSRDIYFTDPGFKPFYYLQCDSKCQFAYHNICWEHLQDSDYELTEPKNLLGTQCPSDKCTTNLNAISIIVDVRLIGLDGFDKPISKFCIETPVDKSAKKSCNISPSVVSNGSSVKSCGGASLRGSESGIRPSGEAPCLAVTICQTPSDKNVEKTTTPAPTRQSNNMPLCSHASPRTSNDQRLYPHPHAAMLPWNRAPLLPTPSPMNLAGYPIVQRAQYMPPLFHMPIYGPQVFHPPRCPRPFTPVPAQCHTYPPTSCVEVVVGSTSVLSAGSRLLVPISPTGGPCQIKLPPVDSCNRIQTEEPSPSKLSVVEDVERRVTKVAEDVPLEEGGSTLLQSSASCDVSVRIGPPKVAELPLNLEGDSVERKPIKSVVEEFKRVVQQLAGEPSPKVYAKKPKCAEPLSNPETLSIRKVLDELKRLFHEVVSDENSVGETSLPSPDFNTNHQNLPNVKSYATTSCPSSISLPLSVTSTSYPHPGIDPLSFNIQSDHFITQSSTFQAKSKCSPLKEKQDYSHEPIVLPRSIIALYCTPLDDIRPEPLTIPDIETAMKIVDKCRAVKFGYSDKEYVNPELQCFGHPFIASSSYVEPEEIEMVDKDHADFVFSYYQSMFDKDGIHRIEDLQEAWTSTLSDSLGLSKTFTDRYTNVAEFLLKSEKFAAIDDVIGTSDLLPDMFSKAEAEIAESVKYLLFTSVSNNNHRDKLAHHANSTRDTQILNHNSNPCTHINSIPSPCPDPSKEDSDGYDQSETGKDDNDNAIFGNSSTCKSDASAMNGEHKTDLKANFVYMSDDDEEIETSLTNDIQPCMAPSDAHEVSVLLHSTPSAVCVVDHDSQTDICTDAEKQHLLEQKEILGKQVSELKYEKTELLQRIEQMESTRANNESQQSNAIKIIQESLEQKLQQKIEELSEIQDKYICLEKELNKAKEDLKDNENQISELGSVSDKLRRTHAKEINNFVKRLQSREDEFKATLKAKDEMYLHLWKEFCEYKINKFNNLCNDRINVLSQLKDMMSDTLRPSKSDIKSSIEKYEEEMITVALKTSEVNEVYTQEKELIMAGKQTSLPSVIDLPDFKNFSYPPEGAFEYLHSLLKPKQEEFGVPRNSYQPPASRFYPRSFTSNGLQSLSQPRESEGFPPVPSLSNSSIFGQQHNETSHLWNNFTAPTPVAPSPVPFDMSNSNGPHLPLHQGFGLPGPLMQPQLNLMSNIMSYQQPSQSSSVQLMGQTRTTPSPSLPFPSMNGSAFNSNQTTPAPGAIGSKVPMVGAVQKPVPNIGLPSSNPVVKSPPLATAVVTSSPPLAPASVSSQGAIPKPRVQAAATAASMTPIVSSKPVARPLSVKGLRTNESNYEKLMRNLQKMFPTRNDVELTHALKMARDKNGNTLSSLTHSEIISKVEEILNKQAKHTSMGWEKFGKAAWGTAKAPVVEWEGSEQDECCICMTAMHAKEVYTLECKHAFHKECIRKWLLHDSVCPNCRTHSTMLDEFPPLG